MTRALLLSSCSIIVITGFLYAPALAVQVGGTQETGASAGAVAVFPAQPTTLAQAPAAGGESLLPAKPAEATGGTGAAEAAKDAKPAEPELLRVDPTEHGWTIHAVNANCHELLTTFAAKARLPLIVDDTVNRNLTVHIVDKPADEVLNIIVDAYGFSSAKVDGVHIISEGMPRSPSSYLLSDIASVTTKYVAPAQAQQLLPVFLQGQVKLNTDQNAVVLSGPKPVLDKFRQDIEQFDVPAAQIMLDVQVVEFKDVDIDTFAALVGQANAGLSIVTDSLTGQLTLSAIGQLPTTFFTSLDALIENRQATVRANPRIATVSGRGATIFIGQQQYLGTPVSLPSESGRYGGTTNSIDAGVTLFVQPLTGGEGEIILDIKEEISTLSAPDKITGLPEKTTRSANTTVRVRDGQTVITGGLTQAETRAVRREIPILSRIPIIGQLFRSRKIETTKVDLAIFITARSLDEGGHLPTAEEQATKQRVGIDGQAEQ